MTTLLGALEAEEAVAEGRYETREKGGFGGKKFTQYKWDEDRESAKKENKITKQISKKRKATDEDEADMDVEVCTFGQRSASSSAADPKGNNTGGGSQARNKKARGVTSEDSPPDGGKAKTGGKAATDKESKGGKAEPSKAEARHKAEAEQQSAFNTSLENIVIQAQKKTMASYKVQAAVKGNKYAEATVLDLKVKTAELEKVIQEAKGIRHFRKKSPKEEETQAPMTNEQVQAYLVTTAQMFSVFDQLHSIASSFDRENFGKKKKKGSSTASTSLDTVGVSTTTPPPCRLKQEKEKR